MAKRKAKTQLELQGIVSSAVEAAVDFIESDISPDRAKALKYFNGHVDIGHEPGRSKVVATKVRDTVRAIKPSLLRVFLRSKAPVEFKATGPASVQLAAQATQYCRVKLTQAGGYRLLRGAFHDALTAKIGILKAGYSTDSKTTIHTYTGLTPDELSILLDEPGVEVLEFTEYADLAPDPATGAEVQMTLADVKLSRTHEAGKLCIDPIPPENFFVDGSATSPEDASVVGHSADMPVADAMAMGFSEKDLEGMGCFGTGRTDEELERRGYIPAKADAKTDALMRMVTITEAYMRVDAAGTGRPVLHKFILGGTSYKLLSHEPADEIPYVIFQIDPIPHAFFGHCIYDLIHNEQDAGTGVLRSILDNVQMTNTPRVAAVEGMVNMDDLLNNEIGGVVRIRQAGAIQDLAVPFTAGQTLGALQYLDDSVETKTGVTRASTGLDPDALQSTTKVAVNATISAAAGQVEVIASNLAEGLAQLYRLMLRIMVRHATAAELLRINGTFVQIDPREWDVEMDIEPNVGLGTGREEEQLQALSMILQFQERVLTAMGPANGLVGLTHVRNTVADIAALGGIHDADRYMAQMTPEIEQQLQQQAQQAQQGAGDPSAALAQAEVQKAGIKAQSDGQKLQQKHAVDQARLSLEVTRAEQQDDRERDRMSQDLALSAAEMQVKYGAQLNTAAIKAEQAAPRNQGGSQ